MSRPRWRMCGPGEPNATLTRTRWCVTVVVDASAIVEVALDGDTPVRRSVLEVLRTESVWVVPDYTDIEVVSAIGRVVRRGELSAVNARSVLSAVASLPFTRVEVRAVSGRVVELMSNHSAYDAGYIAIAEQLGARVLTLDRAMAASPVARCGFVDVD